MDDTSHGYAIDRNVHVNHRPSAPSGLELVGHPGLNQSRGPGWYDRVVDDLAPSVNP